MLCHGSLSAGANNRNSLCILSRSLFSFFQHPLSAATIASAFCQLPTCRVWIVSIIPKCETQCLQVNQVRLCGNLLHVVSHCRGCVAEQCFVLIRTQAHNSLGGRQRRSTSFSDQIYHLDELDAQSRYEEETADRGIGALHNIRSRTRSRTDETLISWEVDDPENPVDWSNVWLFQPSCFILLCNVFTNEECTVQTKKKLVVLCTSMLVINSTMGSALPSMAIPDITKDFNITSEEQSVLPISVYLIGYVLGPIVWGPLSEHYGRRNLSFVTFCLFTIFTMACAVAPSWAALLIFRFFCGAFASSPIAIVAGILADIYDDPRTRGRAFAIFMVVSYATTTPPGSDAQDIS